MSVASDDTKCISDFVNCLKLIAIVSIICSHLCHLTALAAFKKMVSKIVCDIRFLSCPLAINIDYYSPKERYLN